MTQKEADKAWSKLDVPSQVIMFVMHTLGELESNGYVTGTMNSPRIGVRGRPLIEAMKRAKFQPTDEQVFSVIPLMAEASTEDN